jgi:hypothetical protein
MSLGNPELKKVRYHAPLKAWVASDGTEWLLISDALYQRVMSEHLARKGIERRTWRASLHRPFGAQEWHRQVEEENCLRTQYDFWQVLAGVQIIPKQHQ